VRHEEKGPFSIYPLSRFPQGGKARPFPLGGRFLTQNNSNGWFMGVTPNLVGGVWTGWEDQSIHFETIGEGQGAEMALPIFAMFLKKVYADPELGTMQADEFERPESFNMELDCAKVRQNSPGLERAGRFRY
jgi:penicillin-binding protein 1A